MNSSKRLFSQKKLKRLVDRYNIGVIGLVAFSVIGCTGSQLPTEQKQGTEHSIEFLDTVPQILPELSNGSAAETSTTLITNGTMKQRVHVADDGQLSDVSWHTTQDDTAAEFVRINVSKAGEKSWDVNLKSTANQVEIKKGQWLYSSYYVRASTPGAQANVRGFIEANKPNWKMISDLSTITSDNWTQVTAYGKAPQDQPVDSVFISLHLATQIQSVDIAAVNLVVLPSDTPVEMLPISTLTYEGIDRDAPWRAQAEAMIREHRMGRFQINVKDSAGKPITNQPIVISQSRLGFDIGSFISPMLVSNEALTSQYRQWFDEFFNYATAPIYWAEFGWANSVKKAEYHRIGRYFQDNNIATRGHVLMYPGFKFTPNELIALQHDKAAFIKRVESHFVEMVAFLKQYGINEYDVINELRDETDWTDIVGIETVAKWYKMVHQLHPEAILYINENSILTDGGDNQIQQDHYFDMITQLLAMGAPIHGIGMQGHFSGALTPVDKIWQILDRFATFELPIRVTEYDVNHRDVIGQGAYDTDFYTAIFAHPATVGVTRWDFYQPNMWRPLGGLIDDKNQYKPNAVHLLHWLNEKKGTPLQQTTNLAGTVEFEHYVGEYQVWVEGTAYRCSFADNKTQTCDIVVH